VCFGRKFQGVDQRHPAAAAALRDADADLRGLEVCFKARDDAEQEKRAAMQDEIDACFGSHVGELPASESRVPLPCST
jgi:hypothetical protein